MLDIVVLVVRSDLREDKGVDIWGCDFEDYSGRRGLNTLSHTLSLENYSLQVKNCLYCL